MIGVRIDYATPSAFQSDRDRAILGLSANARRPVRFHGRVVRAIFPLRVALRALGEAIWSEETWRTDQEILDPVITIHPDRIFFEAFSQDMSVYAVLIVNPGLFETEGEVLPGTTNVDFTAWLWAALAEMRSSRETWLRVESTGFEVRTTGAGGRYERKVDLPDPWVRGFLNLQGAMAAPGTRLEVRPVDLLAAIRFLRYTKAKVSPRGLRYEFDPEAGARIVLEPWERAFPLKGAEHGYTEPHRIRTFGRRRLRLIEPLLPFADAVTVYLKGRALPSFYAVHLEDLTFVLGLTGFGGQNWSEAQGFHLAAGQDPADEPRLVQAVDLLAQKIHLSSTELAQAMNIDRVAAERLLIRLCRRGRAIYDVERRGFRHRELFEQPIDEAKVFPPDPRLEQARRWMDEGRVRVDDCRPRETRKVKKLKTPDGPVHREIIYRDHLIQGSAGDIGPTEIVVNEYGRIIFGTCPCDFFRDNLLNQGPCAHMLALFGASEPLRRDLPTSQEAAPESVPAPSQSGFLAGADGDSSYPVSQEDEA